MIVETVEARARKRSGPQLHLVVKGPDVHINDILDLPNLQDIKARFAEKFIKAGPDECWQWTAATVGDRYGKLGIDGQLWGAHALAYLFAEGPMPDNYGRGVGKVLCRHTCDNVKCVNPKHIILGFSQQNVQDTLDRHRRPVGDECSFAKLTIEQVRAIRVDARYQRDIAADYGIAQGQVSRIKNGTRWKHSD